MSLTPINTTCWPQSELTYIEHYTNFKLLSTRTCRKQKMEDHMYMPIFNLDVEERIAVKGMQALGGSDSLENKSLVHSLSCLSCLDSFYISVCQIWQCCCIHELTIAVTAYIIPAQDQTIQNPSIEALEDTFPLNWGVIDHWWLLRRESWFSSRMWPQRDYPCSSRWSHSHA